MKVAFLKTKSATVLWDVERIERELTDGTLSCEIRSMSVHDLIEQSPHVDYDVSSCDLRRFPIVAWLGNGKFRLLTGDEQLHKARALAFREISCCVLKPKQHKPYIIGYDEATYLQAVEEYWNYDLEDEDE